MSAVTTGTPLKVAAYCRVSTNHPDQLHSLEAQVSYYKNYIESHSDWELAGIYADVGSGVKTKGRVRFEAMIATCRRRKINLILSKSAHRFARNTVDALKIIRKLRSWGIDIYFELEDIHTLHENSEFILAIICARAQEESFEISQNIKWGLQKAFQNPESPYYQRKCYGYTHDKSGKLIIHEPEAKIVRMIFQMAVGGASLGKISNQLHALQITTPRGGEIWSRETLRKMLQNEKYMGDVMLQKSYVHDYFKKSVRRNSGELERYVVEGNHERIVEHYIKLKYKLTQEEHHEPKYYTATSDIHTP